MHEHPLRHPLHNEIHARPYERLLAPTLISQMAFLADQEQQQQAHAQLCQLLADRHLPLPAPGSSFYVADLGGVRLRWERHTEFTSYTFVRPGLPLEPAGCFEHAACAEVAAAWRDAIPGALLSANHVALLPQNDETSPWLQPDVDALFDTEALVASEAADGQARVYTDLRIHADGFARFVVLSRDMTPRRRGRLVQRLLEIESYRLLALLALPEARRITPLIGQHEEELGQIMEVIRDPDSTNDRPTLQRLSQLAANVEGLYAQHHARFTASSAYYELVNRRIADLHETQFQGLQTIGQFMDRRLGPGMATCAHALRRLQGLSERIARCSSLLRTRVEIELHEQNGEVLASMNQRQYAQLRLQQSVEGLSVAAITYYASSLVGHLFEAARPWLHIDSALAQGISIPLIAVALWFGLQAAHRHIDAPAP
jgi:uncharacterized membrane-anchored protein